MRAAGFTTSLAPMTSATSVVGEFVVDVLELEDQVIGHACLGEQHVHLAGHAAGHRMDGELDRDPRRLQQLDELVELLLALRDREAIARHDDDLFGVAHEDAGVACLDRLEAALDLALLVLGASPKLVKSTLRHRAVHRLRHQQRQQHAGRADHHAGDHQRRVLQHEALEANGEAREGVIDRDDDRHVRAADRQRHQNAEDQRQPKNRPMRSRHADQADRRRSAPRKTM